MTQLSTLYPKSPTVTYREIDFSSVVRETTQYNGAYVGAFAWGPVEVATPVFDANHFAGKFGKPKEWNFLHHFAVEDFLAYSSPVLVDRVVDNQTFNAFAGNNGSGLSGTAQVINGELVGFTFVTYGSNYAKGDIIPLKTTHNVVVTAVIEVTGVDTTGAVTTISITEGGRGYTQGDVLTEDEFKIQIKNSEDFLLQYEQGCTGRLTSTTSLDALYPIVMAKYPGTMGNQLLFSSARASEFDNWEYSTVFNVAPAADVVEYTVEEDNEVITVSSDVLANWAADYVVTLDGVEIFEGTNPGEFTKNIANTSIDLNLDTENFLGDNATTEFTLANLFVTPTTNAVVKVNGNVIPHWNGSGVVPDTYVKVNGNTVTFGVATALASGDGINTQYRLNYGTSTIDTTDVQIFVSGNPFNVVVGPAVPALGDVVVTPSVVSGDNVLDLEFEPTEIPANGLNNIIGYTGYLDATDTIEVKYNYPSAGKLKIFSNQTEIHAVVASNDGTFASEAGEILEVYPFASLAKGTKDYSGASTYWKDAINKSSDYIWAGGDISAFTTVLLSGGTDSLLVGNDEIIAGWKELVDVDETEFRYLIGGPADVTLTNWLIDNVLECRRNAMGAFSPQFDDVVCVNSDTAVANAIAWRQKIHSTSYAITEGNWKYRYDSYNDVYRWLPLCTDTIGIVAKSNQENGVWISPAGETKGRYKNFVRMAYHPSKDQRDLLFPNDINPVYVMKNIGPVLYGDKTLIGRNSSFGEIAIRMLFLWLEENVAKMSKEFLFEINDDFTRRRFKNTLDPYLRGLQGQRAMDEFLVVTDETVNTPDKINNGFMCAEIYIRPNRSIRYMCLSFINTRFGLTFQEVIESQRLPNVN